MKKNLVKVSKMNKNTLFYINNKYILIILLILFNNAIYDCYNYS